MPASRALYGRDFNNAVAQGLAPEQFRWRVLAEGDSWMDRSSALTASLPDHLADQFHQHGESVLIINLSMFGDTQRRIGECVSGEFGAWVHDMAFDAILLSAGGNDFIDAARDPDPGQGILHDLRGQPQPADGRDALRQGALATLVADYLDPNFAQLYNRVRQSERNAHTPIFLNNYDTPVARHAPAPPGQRAWLADAYTRNGIAPALWPSLTAAVFNDLQAAIAGWQQGRSGVFGVPTDGTLAPAAAGSTGNSGDWVNEIHPNRRGWRKLAPLWYQAMRGHLA